jgi:hypothetical protein
MGVPTRDFLEQPRNPIWWAGNLGIGDGVNPSPSESTISLWL